MNGERVHGAGYGEPEAQAAPAPADHIKTVKLWVTNDKGGPALTADAEPA
jgi:hypothetical protein